eukprot:350232-Chlamydomonas_euryale.AAC.2
MQRSTPPPPAYAWTMQRHRTRAAARRQQLVPQQGAQEQRACSPRPHPTAQPQPLTQVWPRQLPRPRRLAMPVQPPARPRARRGAALLAKCTAPGLCPCSPRRAP